MVEHCTTQRGRGVAAATRAPGGCRPRREDRGFFGARPSARFPLFVEQGYTDNRLVSDVALFCVNGPALARDSAPFRGSAPPHTGHHPGSQSGN